MASAYWRVYELIFKSKWQVQLDGNHVDTWKHDDG